MIARKLIKHFVLIVISMASLSPACLIASSSSHVGSWPTYKLDFNAYAQNRLPPPAVMYIFDRSDKLTCAVNTNGRYNAAALDTVAVAIVSDECKSSSPGGASAITKSVRNFLHDQGYKLTDLISKKTPYTALLVIWNPQQVKASGCKRLVKDQGGYVQRIKETFRTHADVVGRVSVRVLSIGASNVHFC